MTLVHGGGAWYHPCLVQVNSTPKSFTWSEMAFSTVLALRVCPVTSGGEPGVIPGLFKSTVLQSFTVMVRNGF